MTPAVGCVCAGACLGASKQCASPFVLPQFDSAVCTLEADVF